MICPSCGKEIPDGYLLCEFCGAEIQIVPNFDPEVENSIKETLSGVADEVGIHTDKQADSESSEVPEAESEKAEKSKSMLLLTLGCILLFALIILVTYFAVQRYRRSSGYLMKQATILMDQENYEEALPALQSAQEAGADPGKCMLMTAQCYKQQQNWDAYCSELLTLIKTPDLNATTELSAYDELIGYYDRQKQYDQINALLQSCESPAVKDKYSRYMASTPAFNYTQGAYNEVVPLKILSSSEGTIYYTLNGSRPNEHSQVYETPIFLESGDYVVTAIFINKYGIASPLAKATYHIEVAKPFAPEVDTYSGDFWTPQLIHAEAEEGCSIYYTTDDSEPTRDSTLYNGFLPMPMGKSTYKFIAVNEEGVSSEVTVRNYNLNLLSDFSISDAQLALYGYMLRSGQIILVDGTISEFDHRRLIYTFACAVPMEEDGDFYIFSEYIQSLDGSMQKTGTYYGVGVYSLPIYKVKYNAETQNFALDSELLAGEKQEGTRIHE